MADDTRESSAPLTQSSGDNLAGEERRIRRPRPKHDFPQSQAGKLWEAFGNPEESANALPGGTYNSAGGKPAQVTWKDAFNFSYNSKGPAWYQTPCARDSLLVGIGGGGAVGGVSFILKGECYAKVPPSPSMCASRQALLSRVRVTINVRIRSQVSRQISKLCCPWIYPHLLCHVLLV